MRKRKNSINQEFTIHKGRVRDALYRQAEIPEFECNPLLEALPPLWDMEQVMKRLNQKPEFKDIDRERPDKERLMLIQTALRFFVPLDVHLDLEQRISSVIRLGYLSRNPFSKEYWEKIKNKLETFDQYDDQYESADKDPSWTASGFTVVGMSGVGKSRSILRILDLYPQVLRHSRYMNRNFTHKQLIWLKVECPHDGSRRGLCKAFLRSVDAALGTNYYIDYGDGKPSIDDLLDALAVVASNHFLGVLVIDEIQRLNLAKSGGDEMMLNFFVQLINTIGVPVILVGTYKAISVLSGEFSQMRRGTGQGDLVWHRMEKDEQWDLFVKTMWKYQYTKHEIKLTQKLKDALYEESQGITDFAVKIFGFAQKRAIQSKLEKITVGIIRSAAKDYLNIPRNVLNAMKTGDMRVLQQFEDVYPRDMSEDFFLSTIDSPDSVDEADPQEQQSLSDKNQVKLTIDLNPFENVPKETNSLLQNSGGKSNKTKRNRPKITEYGLSSAKLRKSDPSIKKRKLINITANLDGDDNSAAYEVLRKGGFMRPSLEFKSY